MWSFALLSLALQWEQVLGVLRANALFAHRVVLQTTDDNGPGARISGTAEPNEGITLASMGSPHSETTFETTAGATFAGTSDSKGDWVIVANMTSGGPYTLALTGSKSKEVLTVKDAMVGDVYICSGQSNMVFPIGAGNPYQAQSGAQSIENATAEIAAGNHPDMRLWFVPSPKQQLGVAPPQRELYSVNAHDSFSGPYESIAMPFTNLTGACNVSSMCYHESFENWGCRSECHVGDPDLVHEWTPISPVTVQPLSAVCYIAVRNLKQSARPGRPVGIIASYVGGTPVGCWTSSALGNADDACNVTPSPLKSVPCDPSTSCCPSVLFDTKISPLIPFNVRAALWYQGEANTDEGYTRTRAEYACQMRLLIESWRHAWGYTLPFFWMQLHGWGRGGGASDSVCFWGGGPHVYDLNCQYAIRLAQNDVVSMGLPLTGMASAIDGCEADANGTTCNLHPGWKTVPATRLAWELENVLFGGNKPVRPVFTSATYAISLDGCRVTVNFELEACGSKGLQLQPVHDAAKIWGGGGCDNGASGIVVINATFDDGAASLVNGTASIVAGKFVGNWASPFRSDSTVVGHKVSSVLEVRYLPNTLPTCVVANADGRPLSPLLYEFPASDIPRSGITTLHI